MKWAVISFTQKGASLSLVLMQNFEAEHEITLYTKATCYREDAPCGIHYIPYGLEKWSTEQFEQADAILFIGACGIAVRAIAHCVCDKLRDPAVLVFDEAGQFAIPVLSGHFGGANQIANEISARMQLCPVITTATDIRQVFAVDLYAKEHGMGIADREGIVRTSASLLAGNAVSVLVSPYKEEENPNECFALQLCPKIFYIGIGCKKGKTESEIEEAVLMQLDKLKIKIESVACISSIDKKQTEEGLLSFAHNYGLPFFTYSAKELSKIEGDFSSSSFVMEQMGTDNVCERAAFCSCRENGRLILPKQAGNGITIAIVKKESGREEMSRG